MTPVVPPENASGNAHFLPSTVCTLASSRIPAHPPGISSLGKVAEPDLPVRAACPLPGAGQAAGRDRGSWGLGAGSDCGVVRGAPLSEFGTERRAPGTEGRGGPGPRGGEGGSPHPEVGGEPRAGAWRPRDPRRSRSLSPDAIPAPGRGRSPAGARTCV